MTERAIASTSGRTLGGGRRLPAERGSAYLITLLALVVITIVGLSLSLITQTEMQLGSNERTYQRIFYAADSGISAATAKALMAFEYEGQFYTLRNTDNPEVFNMRQEVDVSPFFPILSSPCNLCEINQAGQYGTNTYYRVNHAVTAVATRRGGLQDQVLAQKTVTTMVDLQPWRPASEAFLPLTDPEEIKKIKF